MSGNLKGVKLTLSIAALTVSAIVILTPYPVGAEFYSMSFGYAIFALFGISVPVIGLIELLVRDYVSV